MEDERMQAEELARLIDGFLEAMPAERRQMFMCRYWHFDSIKQIVERFSCSESKVKMTLKRMRDALAVHLEEEGVRL